MAVGSYFALDVVANLLVVASSLGSNCPASIVVIDNLAFAVNLLSQTGLSVIGTNILCHRYLLAKARQMINL